MDTRTAQQSVIANTEDMARWCASQAAALDPLIDASTNRPLSPPEMRRVLLGQRELLTRMSQQQTLLATLVFEHIAAPVPTVGFWSRVRRLLR